MNRGKIGIALACVGLAFSSYASGNREVLREIRQHLDLARKSASAGKIDGAIAHAAVVFPDRRFRVRVDCAELPPQAQGLFRNALSGAFQMWETALGQKLFEVTYSGTADVTIRFQPRVDSNGAEVCGHAIWTRAVDETGRQPRPVFTAALWVSTVSPSGAALNFEQIRACAAHELGHVLGLDDSRVAGDVMAPMDLKRPSTCIRPEEVKELIAARDEAARIRSSLTYGFSKRNK